MTLKNTPLINKLLAQVPNHPDFEEWLEKATLPQKPIKELCAPLRTQEPFANQPGRFYSSAIALIHYMFKSWLKVQKKLRQRIEGKQRWLAMLKSDRAFEEAGESWEKWADGLFERLAQKAETWSSEYNSVLEQKDVIQDFANQFMRDIEQEIKHFSETEIQNKILDPKLQTLEKQIQDELAKVKESFSSLENNTTNGQFKFAFSGVEGTWGDFWGYLFGGVAGGGLGAGLMLLEFFMGPVVIAAAVGAGLIGALGFGTGGIKNKIRWKVFNAGCDKFDEVAEELAGKVGETIATLFNDRVESATKAIQEAISICENLIEEEEKQKRKLSAEYETYKIQRSEKEQKLSQTQGEFEKLLNRID